MGMIKKGQRLPSTEILWVTESDVETINLSHKLSGRRVAIFGMPGAFTDTCSELHVPNILGNKNDLLSTGVEEICILTVNDLFVLKEWGRSKGLFEAGISLIGDAASECSKEMGLNFTVPAIGFYDRSLRYAMLTEDGIVKHFLMEETQSGITTSGAEALIEAISKSRT
ncbi:MAG TPA: peroxiredoxin [Deltaproteobacteria bacterium]|nr:MAG: peroxiredoxin [Pseudomonadota bacterium]HBM52064.1 peroxiredoxin [Deltaproteobacteria bacterium]|tara:strand:+ start:11405 stop:11911 length:507 start_codon:yes stop_codon:yes gene_type:complete